MGTKALASSTTALLLVVMCVLTVGILNSSVVFAEEETEEEQSTKEALEEKIMLLQEELDRLTERQRGLSDLAERISFEAELAIKAAEAELVAETEEIESEDITEVITVEQRILDVIQEMQAEGALHEGEFYTTSGKWVQIVSSKNDKVATWDPTIWGKVGWNPHKQTWIEGYVGGWVHSGPTYLDPLSSTGADIQALYVKQSLRNIDGWHKWNDNSLNPYEVIFGYKDYNKKGDDGCFFYGQAGNHQNSCTDVFDDSKRAHKPN